MKRDTKKDKRKQVHLRLDYLSRSGDYLRAVRGTGSLSTEKRERRRIPKLKKLALNSQSIKIMFATRQLRAFQTLMIESIAFPSSIEKNNEKVSENKETIKAMVGETLNLSISTPDLEVIGPRHNHF